LLRSKSLTVVFCNNIVNYFVVITYL